MGLTRFSFVPNKAAADDSVMTVHVEVDVVLVVEVAAVIAVVVVALASVALVDHARGRASLSQRMTMLRAAAHHICPNTNCME